MLRCLSVALLSLGMSACATGTTHNASSVVEYLYPDTKDPVVTPTIPVLALPARVGICFVPVGREGAKRGIGAMYPSDGRFLTEPKKMAVMQQVANHFMKHPFVKSIEIIPSAYLTREGGFTNLDQIRTMYGVNLIALISFDQTQFTDEGVLSFAYWTVVGAYVVQGQKNDTHTMLDAVVIDVPSRKMLFRAPGTSFVKGSATLVNLSEQLRRDSDAGFDEATKQMITNLDQQLVAFRDKVKANPEEYAVVNSKGKGGGALGGGTLALLAVLAVAGWWKRRRA